VHCFHCITVIQRCTKDISMPVLSMPQHLFPDMCVNVYVCTVSRSFMSYKHILFFNKYCCALLVLFGLGFDHLKAITLLSLSTFFTG
jgi:hypothetical protein